MLQGEVAAGGQISNISSITVTPCASYMCIRRISNRVEKQLLFKLFSIVLLNDSSSQRVIKDCFQIAVFKENVLIVFSYIAHQQAQRVKKSIYVYIYMYIARTY